MRGLRPSLVAAVLAAGVFLAGAAPALAADSAVMVDFRRLCVATGGAAAKVSAAAEQSGWKAVPPEAFGGDDDIEVHAAYMTSDPDGLRMVAVMRGEIQPGIFGRGCLVGAEPARAPALKSEAEAFARVPEHTSMDMEGSLWVYVDGGSGRRDLSTIPEDAVIELAKTSPVQAVFFANRDNLAMIAVVDLGAE